MPHQGRAVCFFFFRLRSRSKTLQRETNKEGEEGEKKIAVSQFRLVNKQKKKRETHEKRAVEPRRRHPVNIFFSLCSFIRTHALISRRVSTLDAHTRARQ